MDAAFSWDYTVTRSEHADRSTEYSYNKDTMCVCVLTCRGCFRSLLKIPRRRETAKMNGRRNDVTHEAKKYVLRNKQNNVNTHTIQRPQRQRQRQRQQGQCTSAMIKKVHFEMLPMSVTFSVEHHLRWEWDMAA